MLRKYLPIIFLLAAGLLFYWIKTNQRGPALRIPVDSTLPESASEILPAEEAPFNRSNKNVIYTKHALCRMNCRHIDEYEVLEILKEGVINYEKVEEDSKGKTYPIEGITRDKQHVRIVIAPHLNELVVVTAIDLDSEWDCNCK